MLYLLHSTTPLLRRNGTQVSHYLGYCQEDRLLQRYLLHQSGRARVSITRAYLMAGGTLLLARIWPGEDKRTERHIKQQKNLRRLCPLCDPRGYLGMRVPVPPFLLVPASKPPLPRRLRTNGIGSAPGSGIDVAGSYPQPLNQVSTTHSLRAKGRREQTPSGGATSAIAQPRLPDAT